MGNRTKLSDAMGKEKSLGKRPNVWVKKKTGKTLGKKKWFMLSRSKSKKKKPRQSKTQGWGKKEKGFGKEARLETFKKKKPTTDAKRQPRPGQRHKLPEKGPGGEGNRYKWVSK